MQAVGDPAAWLQAHLAVGETTRVETSVRDGRTGQAQPLDPATAIVSAGPTLVHQGRPAVDAVAEGFLDPQDLSFGFVLSQIRQPHFVEVDPRTGHRVAQVSAAVLDSRRPRPP